MSRTHDEPVDGRDEVGVTRHEERAEVGTEVHESGRVRVSKHVETLPIEQTVSRSVEHADDSQRVPAVEGDSGEVETLEDGSVSIPVFEEVLVVTKKLVVRERVIVRKRTVVDEHVLQTELRREHVTVEGEGAADHVGDHVGGGHTDEGVGGPVRDDVDGRADGRVDGRADGR